LIEGSRRQTVAPARTLAASGWRHLRIALVISALYVWCYFLTVSLVAPIQQHLLPSVVMSLLFFPHGLRVIAAWIYGWRSVAYILPGAVLCNLHFAGDRAFDPQILAGTLASLVAAPLAFVLFRRLRQGEPVAIGKARLMAVVEVGFLASVLNLLALKLIYGLAPQEGVVIFVGDTSGLLASLMIVWGVLRFLPRRR
jgi:hypothetical protein